MSMPERRSRQRGKETSAGSRKKKRSSKKQRRFLGKNAKDRIRESFTRGTEKILETPKWAEKKGKGWVLKGKGD